MPPDSGSTRSSARSESCANSRSSTALVAAPPRDVEVAGVDHEVLPERQLLVQAVLLGDHPQPGADAGALRGGIETEEPQRAPTERRDAAHHPHRRGLPGSVRPEEPERLALEDLEVDAVDGREGAEALRQPGGFHEHAIALRHVGQGRRRGPPIRCPNGPPALVRLGPRGRGDRAGRGRRGHGGRRPGHGRRPLRRGASPTCSRPLASGSTVSPRTDDRRGRHRRGGGVAPGVGWVRRAPRLTCARGSRGV